MAGSTWHTWNFQSSTVKVCSLRNHLSTCDTCKQIQETIITSLKFSYLGTQSTLADNQRVDTMPSHDVRETWNFLVKSHQDKAKRSPDMGSVGKQKPFKNHREKKNTTNSWTARTIWDYTVVTSRRLSRILLTLHLDKFEPIWRSFQRCGMPLETQLDAVKRPSACTM